MALGLLTIQIVTNQPYLRIRNNNWNNHINNINIPIANINNSIISPHNSHKMNNNFYKQNNTLYNTFINYLQSENGHINLINNTNINPNYTFNKNTTNYNNKTLQNLYFKLFYNKSIGIYPSYYNITKSYQDWLFNDTPQNHVYFGTNDCVYHQCLANAMKCSIGWNQTDY